MLVALAHVLYSLFLSEKLSVSFSIFNLSGLSIPLVYSFVSLVGAFLLLLSTPLGFARMFDLSFKSLFENDNASIADSLNSNGTEVQDEIQPKPCPDSPLTRPRLNNGHLGETVRLRTAKTPKISNLMKPVCQTPPKLSRIRRILKASVDPLRIIALLILTVSYLQQDTL